MLPPQRQRNRIDRKEAKHSCQLLSILRGGWYPVADQLALAGRRPRALASWDELALWIDGEAGPSGILRIPIEGHRGLVEAYDAQWKRHPDEDAFVREHSAAVARLALDCRRFLR